MGFWGVINAPTARLVTSLGSPQFEFYGSMLLGEANAPVQFGLHYDEALAGNRIGRYERRNWVQEAT